MTSILIATTNPGKLGELFALLASLPYRCLSPKDLNLELDVAESGSTYAENAALKAQAWCQVSGMPSLADDTGLEVDALGGLPGLHSARFTGDHAASDTQRRTLLLSRLASQPKPWKAHFHCTVALALPTDRVLFGNGICPGTILDHERGSNGFGYDPIFLLDELPKTMAELSMEEKNQLSHRARAIQDLLPSLFAEFPS